MLVTPSRPAWSPRTTVATSCSPLRPAGVAPGCPPGGPGGRRWARARPRAGRGAGGRVCLPKVAPRCEQRPGRPDVVEATVFTAIMVAPGEGTSLLEARAAKRRRARHELAVRGPPP